MHLAKRATVLIGAVALLIGSVPFTGAARQNARALIRVSSISPFVDATRPLRIAVQVTNATDDTLEDVTMRASIHAPVISRSLLRQAVDEGAPTATLATLTAEAPGPIAPGAATELLLERAAAQVTAFSRTGVYPIQLTIEAGTSLTLLRTAVPYLAVQPETRVNVTWLLAADEPTALRGDGTYDREALDVTDLDALRAQMEVLAARPGLPVTFVPEGSLVDALADRADGFRRRDGSEITDVGAADAAAVAAGGALEAMRRATAVVGEVATTTYTAADLSALTRNGLGSEVIRQLTASRRAVEQHLARTPTFRFFAPRAAPVGAAEAETLATLGVEHVTADVARLTSEPKPPPAFAGLRYDLFGVSRPVLLRARPHRFGALVIDPDLRRRLQSGQQAALMAQNLIAETASSWLEVPLFAPERVLVLSSKEIPEAPALAATLDGLAAAPWVQLRTASDALALLPPGGPAIRLPTRRPRDRPPLAAARRARTALGTLEAITAEPHPRAQELERMTLLAASIEWTDEPSTGETLARAASDELARIVAGISIAKRVVTLTSRTGPLPVTITNDAAVPVRIRVGLESPKARFPGGDTKLVDLREQATLEFTAEALATGSFPVAVVIQTPDGSTTLKRGRIVLRSTAVSAVALAAVGGSALLLLLGSFHRRRRTVKRRGPTSGG